MNIEERRTDKISIIVPCYNEEACIEIVYAETAAAMEALTEKEQVSYEIIFVDDGSRDGTLKELRELAAKEKKEIERILAELSADCAAHKEDILEDYQLIVWLDTIFARAQLSLKLECSEPKLSDKFLRLRRERQCGGRIPAQAEKTLAEVSSGGYECQEAVSCSGSGTEESRRQTIARSAAASPVPKSKRSAETNLAGTSPANPKRP